MVSPDVGVFAFGDRARLSRFSTPRKRYPGQLFVQMKVLKFSDFTQKYVKKPKGFGGSFIIFFYKI
jgi:hypothetical protein